MLGQILDDRYRVVRRVARGGMAMVFEAVDERLSRTVAIKVMHAGLDEDADVAARFDTEARTAATLSHPNVVAVFDQGTDDGRPYIVMEYVRGLTLRQLITLEAPFPPARALQLFEPICAALAAAHDNGLIHRDIKPENVLISERGQIKVADFGLARNLSGTSVMEGGVVIGTVSYIAPELVARGYASPRSDVYSLGIVLYELLTGTKPYRSEIPVEVAYAHVHRDVPAPSASLDRGALPRYLDTLVRTTTARSLARRQENAGVLLRQVRAARDSLTRGVRDEEVLEPLMRAGTADDACRALQSLQRTPPRTLARSTTSTALVTAGSGRSARSAASAPRVAPQSAASASSTREIRLTPNNVSSPTFDMVEDGLPYYSDGPDPLSPESPSGRTGGVPPRSEWLQTPVHRRRRLAVALTAALVIGVPLVSSWTAPRSGTADAAPPATATATATAAAAAQASDLITVPTLIGRPRDDALRLLTDAGLTAGAITERFDDAPAGSVVAQASPVGSTLRRGAAVDFVLSRGPQIASVGDFTGKPLTAARRDLAAAGLKVKVTEDFSSTVARGSVISQTPPAGQARPGDTIELVVSKGARPVVVPDVRHLDASTATARLQAAGFVVTVTSSSVPGVPPGTVAASDPGPGRRADEGSRVTIAVG